MIGTLPPHVMESRNNLHRNLSDSTAALSFWASAETLSPASPFVFYDLGAVDPVFGEGAVDIFNATAMTSPDSMTMAAAAEAMTNGDDNSHSNTVLQSPQLVNSEPARAHKVAEQTDLDVQSSGRDTSTAIPLAKQPDNRTGIQEDATSMSAGNEGTLDSAESSGSVPPEVVPATQDSTLNHVSVSTSQNVAQNEVDWSGERITDTALMPAHNALLNHDLLSGYDTDHAQNLLALQNGGDIGIDMEMQMGIGMDMGMGLGAHLADPFLEPSSQIYEELQSSRVSAYAKLVFDDGEFYMNTYSIVLGRDVNAAKNALRREKEEERARLESVASAQTPVPHTPRLKKEGSRYTKSIVSESGGILRDGNDSDDEEDRRRRKSRRSKKASKKSKSSESSQNMSRRNSIAHLGDRNTYNTYAQVPTKRAALDTAVPVNPETLKPSPHDCPLVGIHPAAKDGVHAPHSAYKSISRKHVKIAYNSRKNYWEADIMGRNGTFIDDKFCHYKQVVCLTSGSRLQVGGVVVTFQLPDIPLGQTGAESPEFNDTTSNIRHSIGGKEMSFDFEDDPRAGAVDDSSEGDIEDRVRPSASAAAADDDDDDDDDDDGGRNEDSSNDQDGQEEEEEEEDEESAITYEPVAMNTEEATAPGQPHQSDMMAMPPKKRGPGRPPKNGIMSKREQQLAKKEALARERELEGGQSAKPTITQPSVPGKNKVGRPRKHPRPDTPPEPREKRKYTKRKPKEPKEGDPLKQEGSGGEEVPAKEKKEKKPPKPERSPSPTFVESELTEQQLAKPQANYVTLIYEALENSKNGQMSLPQIYRAIQRKYPYFVLKVPTTGWQSSVRHNLSQNQAFRKIERDGKGWMWGIVPGVPIEKEKKKRITPPPQSHPGLLPHQPMYQPGHPPHLMPYGQHNMMAPSTGYPMPHQLPPNFAPAPYPGQPPLQHPHYPAQPYPAQPQHNGHPPPPGLNHQMHPIRMHGQHAQPFMPPVAPQLIANTGATYSSPYGPKPTHANPPNVQQPQSAEQKLPPVSDSSSKAVDQPVARTSTVVVDKVSLSPEDFRSAVEGSNELINAVERFRSTLVSSLQITKALDPEKTVNSAINRVLGRATETSVPSENEALITNAFKQMLETNMSTLEYASKRSFAASPPRDQVSTHSSPQPLANQNGTQPPAAQHSVTNASRPTIMRPTFSRYGPGRSAVPTIPRPPMTTPGMKRADSGTPATTIVLPGQYSVSPGPPLSRTPTHGASALQSPVQETHQAGASVGASLNETGSDVYVKKEQLLGEQAFIGPPVLQELSLLTEMPRPVSQVVGQKRERTPKEPDMDDMPNAKKLASSGPPELTA
jgi:hypothetical protein